MIFDHPFAAVVIVGLASRIKYVPESPMVVALKRTARDISAQLFHPESMAEFQSEQTSANPVGD